MKNTIVYMKSGRVNIAETLRDTAIAIRAERKQFHVSEIVDMLAEQGFAITKSKVRSQLSYSGAAYTGQPRKRQYWQLEKLENGMYEWARYEFDPNACAKNMIKKLEA